jgi:hypothetical protein
VFDGLKRARVITLPSESTIGGVEVRERNILIPSDNPPAGPTAYACLLGPISLGERRKFAEQREMLESGWVSRAEMHFVLSKGAQSRKKRLNRRTKLQSH